jgi:polygalacturonase
MSILQKKKYHPRFICIIIINCCFLSAHTTDINILSTGALPDGKTVNSIAIQKAIDSCAATGGGKVVVPAGVFVSGSLQLHSGIELHLQSGAVLMGSRSMADYPLGSLLVAKGCTNVQLTGTGTINGSGDAFYDQNFQPLQRPLPFLLFDSCRFLRIRDVKVVNSPSHVFRIVKCSEVVIDGIYLNNPERSPNTDGIDLVDSRNVYISNSTLITGDDAICLKSHFGKVENVTVTNCTIQSDDAAIKCGTGSKDTIQHCVFSNIVIRNTRYGLALFMQEGGVYRYLLFNNISIQTGGRNKNHYPVFVDVDRKRAGEKLGRIENISFSNLQIETRGNILIAGQPSAPLRHISLHNISMRVRDCHDLSKQKKPRGNKNTPVFADTKDLANVNAHVVIAYVDGLYGNGVQVVDECKPVLRKPQVEIGITAKTNRNR